MKHSLIKKTILIIICVALVIGTFAIAVYNKGLYDVIISQYGHYSTDITKLVAANIDAERLANVKNAVLNIYEHAENKVMSDSWGTPEFDAYVAQYASIEEMDDYKVILAYLQKMQAELDVDCLYTIWVDAVNECYLYLVDAALEEPCPVGCIDPLFFDDIPEALRNLHSGMAPNITKTEEYGWLMATAMPIFDDNGEIIAMSAVDISMNAAMDQLVHFMFFIEIAFIIAMILSCVLIIFLINKRIINPINKLSRAAADYKNNKNAFSELNIKRKDEIGALAESMVQMEKDIDGYITDLSSAREHADKMYLAANTDALTKVRNKRAYDSRVKQINNDNSPYAIALIDINNLKMINDTYGHEKGDISIKSISRIIYHVFDRSTVYRIGGDEFVVILENEDYENREELIKELTDSFKANELNESLEPWERVSASIGYSDYDPATNETVQSVLERADAAMYEHKKEMKESK